MYLNGNGKNVLQPNPNLPYSNYHILSADSIYEHLNTNAIERYLGRELTRQAVELIFSRDAVVRKAISSWGQWMSLAPWDFCAI